MRLKTVTAADPARALSQIRALLGEDAIIVATQDLKDGGVRVTAAVDSEDLDLADLLAPADTEASEEPAWLAALARHHELSERLRGRVREALAGQGEADVAAALAQALHAVFRFAPLPVASPVPLLTTGPPGAGKTASIAKLAARAVLGGRSVAVLSTDVGRAGGLEQLAALLAPLGLQPQPAEDAGALRSLVTQQTADLTLIDSPGLNPFKPADLGRLSALIDASRGEPVLVLPAGLAAGDCADIAHTFHSLGVHRFLASKLDTARRLGGLLAAAEAGLAWSDAGIGPTIGRGLSPLGATGLARVLMHAQTSASVTPPPREPGPEERSHG